MLELLKSGTEAYSSHLQFLSYTFHHNSPCCLQTHIIEETPLIRKLNLY